MVLILSTIPAWMVFDEAISYDLDCHAEGLVGRPVLGKGDGERELLRLPVTKRRPRCGPGSRCEVRSRGRSS